MGFLRAFSLTSLVRVSQLLTSWYPLYTVAKLPLPISPTTMYGRNASSSTSLFEAKLVAALELAVRLVVGAVVGIVEDNI